jgi:glyoxylase-like metal-dependent hydrolase (beta-lactamase superfamily II)
MLEVTGTAQLNAWRQHLLPPVEKVRDGLWSVPVPLPNHVLRYVSVYAFELATGLAIVDAGWDTGEAWAALGAGLAAIGYQISDVRAILVTHAHRDHYGLASRVRAESGAWIGMHEAEALTLPRRLARPQLLVDRSREWLLRCGAPAEEVEELSGSAERFAPLLAMPDPDRLICDGDKVDVPGWDVRAIWTPGHTPGHLCFHEQDHRILISGDHILPRITPNISAQSFAADHGNPLAKFLFSLSAVRELNVTEVLPAHEYRFRGLADRVDALLTHHEGRLAEVMDTVRRCPSQTTWQIASRLTWSRPWEQVTGYIRRSAMGETLAHLVLLSSRSAVCQASGPPDRWTATVSRTLTP